MLIFMVKEAVIAVSFSLSLIRSKQKSRVSSDVGIKGQLGEKLLKFVLRGT